MSASHQFFGSHSEHHVLVQGILVALASLENLDVPKHKAVKWTAVGRTSSTRLNYCLLRCLYRNYEVRFSYDGERLQVAIHGANSGSSAPVLTIVEVVPKEHGRLQPTVATLRDVLLTMEKVCSHLPTEIEAHRQRQSQALLIGAILLGAGGDPELLGPIWFELPSIYRRGQHRANDDHMEKIGPSALVPIEALYQSPSRERLIAAGPTVGITCQFWNMGNIRRIARARFDMSAVLSTKAAFPNPVECLRLLSS